jgi:DNA-binding response OmpR family regulator
MSKPDKRVTTILVADNEPDTLRFIGVNLRLEGFDVVCARDGGEALKIALTQPPGLVLLDVTIPGMDGYEVCRRLRAHPRTAQLPVIFLTARSLVEDKVAGLASGADDYVLKPFDPVELIARIHTTLQRSEELRGTSPLTGLPGNHRIQLEVARRLADEEPLAVIYADLNDFKAFNDRYGFLRGDEVILATAELLREALDEHAAPDAFIGHIGGDDFMLLCGPGAAPAVCETAIARFDSRVPGLYDPEDAAAGYLEVKNRRGQIQRFPLMTIALGVATNERRVFTDPREIVEVATEMKSFLKQTRHRSAYAVDEREDDEAADLEPA